MKRIKLIAITLTLMLALGLLTGCGKKAEPADPAAEDAAEEGEDSESEAAEAESEATAEETEEDVPLSETVGDTTETSYTNSTFGFTFTAPDSDWYFATPEELSQLMGMADNMFSDEELDKIIEESGYIIDFYANNTNKEIGQDSINLTIQDIGRLYSAMYSAKQIAESSLEAAKKALQEQGWTVENMEVEETEFCGKTTPCIITTCSINGITMYQKQVVLKTTSYVGSLTASSFDTNGPDEILSYCVAA